MPRQAGTVVVNNFTGGLTTEATALRFPENACTETFNCIFDETGRVIRRLGIDLELSGTPTAISGTSADVFTEFRWDAVSGLGTTSFIVQQWGSTLKFFDISVSTEIQENDTALTVDLTTFVAADSDNDPADFACQYASGTGRLLVANRVIDPLVIEYDANNNVLNIYPVDIRVRDFTGLFDGLLDQTRPENSVATLISGFPAKYYNLLNQGWYAGDALSQWDTARTDMPSNRDYPALYRSSATDAFDNALVTANTPGLRPAPKGHFILNAWNPDHTLALLDEGFSATITPLNYRLDQYTVAFFSNYTNAGAAFDRVSNQAAAACATHNTGSENSTIGRTFASPTRVVLALVSGSNDVGYYSGANPTVTIDLYGSHADLPANETDGILLGTLSFTDTDNESTGRQVVNTNFPNIAFRNYFVHIHGSTNQLNVAELSFFAGEDDPAFSTTTERPRCVEFFAGRAWYAGVDHGSLNSKIYFSQIIESVDQFGRCYQANDPTAEDFTDLLPDDGGVIVIPEIAKVTRLFAYQSTLLIFATNGIWMVTGSQAGGFLATDFVVRKLTSEGMNAPESILSYKGVPAWWGDNGIFTIQFDPNYQSFNVVSLTDTKIARFISDIPAQNRLFVKGVFHVEDETGYWLYNDETAGYTYNSVLVINGLSGAFYPWSIQVSSGVDIRGLVYVQSPSGAGTPNIKFSVTKDINGTTENLFYAEHRQSSYLDWSLLSVKLGDSSIEQDYESYFITGYRLEGQAMRFFQPNYIMVYHEDDDGCASCFVQGVFDFAISGDSGKWSSRQQCFNNCLRHRNVNYTRLKIRGKGRSLQLKFSSETGKPFTIIGWALWITGNAGV